MVLFVIAAVILLGRTPFGRRVYGIGNGVRAAELSGIAVGRTLILVYMLSGVLLGAGRHPAHRLFGPGEPRHGR